MMSKPTRLTSLALAVLVMLTALSAAPVAAQENSGLMSSLFDSEDEGLLDRALSYVSGVASATVDKVFGGDDGADATDYATDTRQTFNEHSVSIQSWVNARATATDQHNVARVQFSDEDGNKEWLFIVSDVNATSGEYENLTAMNLTEFKSTNYEIDETYRLSPYASRMAEGELDTFVEEYAEPDENPTSGYLAELYGQYGGEITGTDLPGDDD